MPKKTTFSQNVESIEITRDNLKIRKNVKIIMNELEEKIDDSMIEIIPFEKKRVIRQTKSSKILRGLKPKKNGRKECSGFKRAFLKEIERNDYVEIAQPRRKKSDFCVDMLKKNEDECMIKFEAEKPKKDVNKRRLSYHVVSRWYRSPELILLEKSYTSSIDIWSVGCILGELMIMIKESFPHPNHRFPLFPGHSCYPISPSNNQKANPNNELDQLYMITDLIGTPSDEELSFINDITALNYIKSFPKKIKKDFSLIFKGSSKECIDLLERMLTFNPEKRINLEECLNHEFFLDIRNKKSEINSDVCPIFEFENYEYLNEEKLRELFIEEIIKYN